MRDTATMPVHPSKRHPLTGQPLQALWVRPDGRICWPVMGGAPDDPPAPPTPPAPPAPPAPSNSRVEATDAAGVGLGFPKDTPVAEMADKEQAAYWRNNSRKHEGRVKDLLGDRTPEDIKKDLEAYAQLKKAEQTPAEQALAAAREEGKAEARTAERAKSAAAIFRGALEANGVTGEDLDELIANFNVAGYISDDGVDTTKITNFAKRFTPVKGNQQERRRDFGGGQRREGAPERGAAGKAMAEKRFGKKTTA